MKTGHPRMRAPSPSKTCWVLVLWGEYVNWSPGGKTNFAINGQPDRFNVLVSTGRWRPTAGARSTEAAAMARPAVRRGGSGSRAGTYGTLTVTTREVAVTVR
jgi:hypothetical protein